MNNCKKLKYWENHPKKRNTKEWIDMPVDWLNEHKLGCVNDYFFRYDNFIKGEVNEHIMKSTFGRKSKHEIEIEIYFWFDKCIGVYSEIEI